ncbi:MAG: thioredoxin [Phycisphaerae bacterium]|nr:thioredoxin [Phycisphaerae bacterium]
MASEALFEFTDDNFEADAINSEMPVLVDFWAEWCQPCKMLGPTIDELAADYAGRARIGKMNIDDNQAMPVKYGVQSIPTVLILKNGEVVNKFVGVLPKTQFSEAIDSLLVAS